MKVYFDPILGRLRVSENAAAIASINANLTILNNNVYKVVYYEIISGATGSVTIPTGATINAGEFSGANCILSEIDGSNKITWVSPEDASGNVVTATLNTVSGAWVKSGVTVSANVAIIYSINISGLDYQNLNNFYIVEETTLNIKGAIDANQVAVGSAADTISGSSLFTWSGTILKLGSTAFTSSLSGGIVQIEGTNVYYSAQSTNILGTSGFRFGQNNSIYGTLQSQGSSVGGNWTGTSVARTSATELIAGGTSGANNMILAATNIYGFIGTTATNFGYKLDANGFRIDQIQNLHTANATGVTFGSVGTNGISFQGLIGTTTSSAIYLNQASPSSTNYALMSTAAGSTNINGSVNVIVQVSGVNKFLANSNGFQMTPGTGIAGTSHWQLTFSNKSNETASTNVPKMVNTLGSLSWATGALAQGDIVQWTQPTIAFTGASTATLGNTFTINGAPLAGSNATITNSSALYIGAGSALNAVGTVTNGYGLYVNAPTGATNNYALYSAGATLLGVSGSDHKTTINTGTSSSAVVFMGKPTATTQSTMFLGVPTGTESSTNYTLNYDGILNLNTQTSTSAFAIRVGGNVVYAITPSNTGNTGFHIFSVRTRTSLSTTANVPTFQVTGNTGTWASGTVAAQYFTWFMSQTMGFSSGSTATYVTSMCLEMPTRGTNATFTTVSGLYIPTLAYTSTTDAIGIDIEAPTGATNNYAARFGGSLLMNGRILGKQGADVASANNLSLGTDGNTFEITGTTQINLLSNVGWQNGSRVTLMFTSTPTVKHNQATSGSNITILLNGAADFIATAGDIIDLVLSEIGGVQAWRQPAPASII